MSIMHADILLMSKRAFQLNIFLVELANVSYFILIQQYHLAFFINIYAIIIGTPLVLCKSRCWFMQF